MIKQFLVVMSVSARVTLGGPIVLFDIEGVMSLFNCMHYFVFV